jgi:hypothetical protein
MHRLDSISPDLVAILQRASPATQRRAALAACEFAVVHSGSKDATIAKALKALRQPGTDPQPARSEIQAIVQQLDAAAFRAQDLSESGQGSDEDYTKAFAKARCAAAVSFARLTDPLEAALEAVYEAAMTTDDPVEIIAVVQSVL